MLAVLLHGCAIMRQLLALLLLIILAFFVVSIRVDSVVLMLIICDCLPVLGDKSMIIA